MEWKGCFLTKRRLARRSCSATRLILEKAASFELSFTLGGVIYKYRSIVECYYDNFYYTGYFMEDGVRKDVRLFKKLLRPGLW